MARKTARTKKSGEVLVLHKNVRAGAGDDGTAFSRRRKAFKRFSGKKGPDPNVGGPSN